MLFFWVLQVPVGALLGKVLAVELKSLCHFLCVPPTLLEGPSGVPCGGGVLPEPGLLVRGPFRVALG